MTAKTPSGLFSTTAPSILCYPKNLFVATQYQGKGDYKFGAQIVLAANHPDIPAIQNLITKLANEAQPGIVFGTYNVPLHRGETLADQKKAKDGEKYRGGSEFMRGQWVIKSRSQFPPALSIIENGQLIKLSDDALRAKYKDKFFWGAEVIAEINFVWYATAQGKGVTAYVNKVLANGKGTKMGGGIDEEDSFSEYLGKVTAQNPMGATAPSGAW